MSSNTTAVIGNKVIYKKLGRTITDIRGDILVLDGTLEANIDAIILNMPGCWTKGYYAAAVFSVRDSRDNYKEHEFISRDELYSSDEEALNFGEIHSPVFELEDGQTLELKQGGYVVVTEYASGLILESGVISRQQFDYFNDPDQGDDYDPDAAYERHLEDRGWMDAAAQDEYEARMGCLDYRQAKAVAEGRIPE